MSGVKWTEDQQKAIDLRYRNILVSAAAGSGKTAVLVERIINIITDKDNPVDIDKLLIVTFTNAAAAEMRERIGEAINKKINENPNSRNLQRQLILLNKASISTLHSFCLNLIKNNFHQLDIEPNFRVGDTTEINLLKVEAMEELLEEKYKEGSERFLSLVESYCDNKSDRALSEIILKLYGFSMSMAEPEEWLLKSAERFNIPEDFSFSMLPFKAELLKELREEILEAMKLNNRAMDFILNYDYLNKYVATFEEDGEILEKTLEIIEGELTEGLQFLEGKSFSRIPTILKLTDEEKEIQGKAKALRDEVKELWTSVKMKALKAVSKESMDTTRSLYPRMQELAALVIDFKKIFQDKKRERGIIDFNDQEHFALEILKSKEDRNLPSDTALSLKNKYEEILVDEYQDSNNVQEEIVSLICKREKGKRNIFMVGDLKQSIYRFRMAKPELFKEKKESYTKEDNGEDALITLHKNFRSRKEVIDGINYIFKGTMSEEVGELTYDEEEELKTGATFKDFDQEGNVGGPVELNIIDLNLSKEDEEEATEEEGNEAEVSSDENSSEDEPTTEELDAMELEARFVAKRIRSLMEEKGEGALKVYDKHLDQYRKATYKDIVILLRSSNKLSPIFIEEFKSAGIPIFSEGGGGYFDTLEIKTILSLLEIIDNPVQDIPLIAALRSPIGGFTTEDLADIRISNKNCSFYEAMVRLAAGEETSSGDSLIKEIYEKEELKVKITDFLERIDRWRLESRYTPINKLIWDIITTTGYYGYVGALPGGEQRQANLKILFKRAKEFERTSYKGLYSFINFIHNIKSSSEDLGSAKIIGENEDVVRIMSIHKSKGLEFPIVFLCGLSKRFNEGDLKGKILYHQQLGFGPVYIDLDKRISFNTIQREFISKKIKSENISEEMRLLYVALTRAKEKLILVGSSKGVEKRLDKWAEAGINAEGAIEETYIKRQKSYLDWVGAALINHKDGSALRHYGGNRKKLPRDEEESKFKINILGRADFEEVAPLEEVEKSIEDKLKDLLVENKKVAVLEANIKEALSFTYAFKEAAKMPTVTTVTKLKEAYNQIKRSKGASNEEEAYDYLGDEDILEPAERRYTALLETPLFLQEKKGLTSAEIGTAYHSIMQRLKLQENMTMEEIKKQIEDMVNLELITYEAAKAVKVDRIFNFFNTSMGKEVIAAAAEERLKRELPFRIEIDATAVYPHIDPERYKEDKMLLRGVIDCYIDKGDEGIIIDYKTDYVANNLEDIVEGYKVQLQYYGEAVQNAFHKKKVRKYLYLFSINEFIEVE